MPALNTIEIILSEHGSIECSLETRSHQCERHASGIGTLSDASDPFSMQSATTVVAAGAGGAAVQALMLRFDCGSDLRRQPMSDTRIGSDRGNPQSTITYCIQNIHTQTSTLPVLALRGVLLKPLFPQGSFS